MEMNMWTTIKTGIQRARDRARQRRDYNYLIQDCDDRMLRDIGVDRIEVKRLQSRLRLI
jgi:hypothetical protein